jgi:uncharacterized membrane protein
MKILILFTFGGFIYGGIEVIAVGFTHISMFITGGICFVLIGSLKHTPREIPVTVQMLISAVMITLLEFICGLIVNLWLRLNVWDYSHESLNLMGQISVNATATWFFLSFFGIYADAFARKGMFNQQLSPMRILP